VEIYFIEAKIKLLQFNFTYIFEQKKHFLSW
jgi:hypothetical protein